MEHGHHHATVGPPPPVELTVPASRFGIPIPALVLGGAMGAVAIAASAVVLASPFDAAAFGGLTVPTVIGAGVIDGLNPCAFALLVLFATFTLTMLNSVITDGSSVTFARQRLLSAGSWYVGAVWITYFLIGLGLFSFLAWLGEDHLVTRFAALVALGMALWMLKDVLLPGRGPALAAPHATHGWMHRAIERGGLGGMLLAGVLVGICTVPCSGAIYLDIVAMLHASGGGPTGLALLALYNLAFIVPLVLLLGALSSRRVLGRMGRWNQEHGSAIKVAIAATVILMSLGLLVTL